MSVVAAIGELRLYADKPAGNVAGIEDPIHGMLRRKTVAIFSSSGSRNEGRIASMARADRRGSLRLGNRD